jgi:hypothetical protein
MKLSDFLHDAALNELRSRMMAELRPYVAAPRRDTITVEEIEALATRGIEIPLEDVQLLNDGTFTYKGRRVVVYIRDQTTYQNHDVSLPKFHLAMCRTLQNKRRDGSYEARYVVAAPEKDMFKIQKIRNNKVISATDEKLDVCQNCLAELEYRNFNLGLPRTKREAAIRDFALAKFFEEYGRSPVWLLPDFDATHAPTNIYSYDFFLIAKRIKEQRGYNCEDSECKRDLSKPHLRRYLHAHHKNHDKSDNRSQNLKLLCVHCHGKEHPHLRNTSDYKEFCSRFGLGR